MVANLKILRWREVLTFGFMLAMLEGCSGNKPEEVAIRFIEAVTDERDAQKAYEMLSKRSQERASFDEFKKELDMIYSSDLLVNLLNFENSKRDLEISSIQKRSDVETKVSLTSHSVVNSVDFFDFYNKKSQNGKIGPEEVFSQENQLELQQYGINLLKEREINLSVVDEGGKWKVDSSDIIRFLSDNDFLGGFIKEGKKIDTEKQLMAGTYYEYVGKLMRKQYRGSEKLIDRKLKPCLKSKFGEEVAGKVIQNHSQDDLNQIIRNCIK